MPREPQTAIENNFTKGLITEAKGLNFPENAVTETWNCVFESTGQVRRRLGFDVESGALTEAYDADTGALTEFLWEAVSRTGVFTFLVLQIGTSISFYSLSTNTALSAGLKGFAVDMNNYKAPGAGVIKDDPCSFASGNGRLFITHPWCDPVMVEYDEDTDGLIETALSIKIRDFEGVDDGLELDEQPETLSEEHLYNLMNQGWNQSVRMVTPGGGAGSDSTGATNFVFNPFNFSFGV